jgi:hypothetical protein
VSTGGATESLASGIRFQHQEGQSEHIRVDGEMWSEIEHKEESPSTSLFPPDGLFERGVNTGTCIRKPSACQDLIIRCYEYVTSVDHLLGVPLESLDSIWNSATMKGVLGWSNQLAETRPPEQDRGVPRHRLAAIASRSEQSSKAEEKDHGSWKGHPRSFLLSKRYLDVIYTPTSAWIQRGL